LIIKRYKKELAGQIGNLLSRAIAPTLLPDRKFPLPPDVDDIETSDHELRELLASLSDQVGLHFDRFEFNRGLSCLSDAVAMVSIR
jgi:methionyl-tRNA synthetase